MKWRPDTPPDTLADWVEEAGSLTARLRRQFGEVAVEVLREETAPATAYERTATGAEDGWVREVILRTAEGGAPLLWARTFIPQLDVANPWFELTKIGSKPLGEVLFSLKDAQMGDAKSGKFSGVENFGGTPRWGRWRPWRRAGRIMILTEVFLFHE